MILRLILLLLLVEVIKKNHYWPTYEKMTPFKAQKLLYKTYNFVKLTFSQNSFRHPENVTA